MVMMIKHLTTLYKKYNNPYQEGQKRLGEMQANLNTAALLT